MFLEFEIEIEFFEKYFLTQIYVDEKSRFSRKAKLFSECSVAKALAFLKKCKTFDADPVSDIKKKN